MTDIGELNLNLDLKTNKFEENLTKAQQRASEAGGLMAGAFDSIDTAISQISKSVEGNLSGSLKREAEKGRKALEGLTQVDFTDFSSLGNVDLSPLTKEIDRIRENIQNPFGDLFDNLNLFEGSTPFEPTRLEDVRRPRRRRLPSDEFRFEERSTNGRFDGQDFDLQGNQNLRAGDIVGRDGAARWNPVAYQNARNQPRTGGFEVLDDYNSAIYANIDYRYSRFRDAQRRHDLPNPEEIGADLTNLRSTRNQAYEDTLVDSLYVGNKEQERIGLPRVSEEGLIKLTEFFNQTQNIEATTSSLVGFIAAWNELLLNADVSADKFGLTNSALESIRDTMRSLDTNDLTAITGYLNVSDDLDDNTASMQEFTQAWNQAMVRAKSAVEEANLVGEMHNIASATQEAANQINQAIQYEGRVNNRSRLGRGVEQSEQLFDAVRSLIPEPRFTGGETFPKRLYSVAEHGPELGKFGDQTVLFKQPTVIRPKVQGSIFSAPETKRLLNRIAPGPMPSPKLIVNAATPQSDPVTAEIKALRSDLQKAIALSGNTYVLGESGDQALDTIANLRTLDMTNLLRRRL